MNNDGAPRLEPRDVSELGAERGDQVDGRFDVSGGAFPHPTRHPARVVPHDGSKPRPNSAERRPRARAS
jgi:hypothetical protein